LRKFNTKFIKIKNNNKMRTNNSSDWYLQK
jgi:hypothetical protein